MILLDTDVCIEILRGNGHVIEKRLDTDEGVAISFMTVGELFYGAEKSTNRPKNRYLVEEFLLTIHIIHTDMEILKKFGELKADLHARGSLLADADILIAAVCLTKCSKLVTGNMRHFERFGNIAIENWIR